MTETPTEPTPLTAKSPEDVLAAVPVVLGFEPTDSVVMLTFAGGENFSARVNLPPNEGIDEVVELLLDPARRHCVDSVLFVLYTDDVFLARRLRGRLVRAFDRARILVVETIRTDGMRWYSPGRPGVPASGVPYDCSGHRFRAQSVLEGRVIHGSREELAGMLMPTAGAAAVERALGAATPYVVAEVGPVVAAALERGRFPDEELAALVLALPDLDARDAAWKGFDRPSAERQVDLWTDAVQRCPEALVAGPAAVLALAAWLAGHGALAWCAVDRSQEVEPGNSLARLVGDLLSDAVPPSWWDRWSRDREREELAWEIADLEDRLDLEVGEDGG